MTRARAVAHVRGPCAPPHVRTDRRAPPQEIEKQFEEFQSSSKKERFERQQRMVQEEVLRRLPKLDALGRAYSTGPTHAHSSAQTRARPRKRAPTHASARTQAHPNEAARIRHSAAASFGAAPGPPPACPRVSPREVRPN